MKILDLKFEKDGNVFTSNAIISPKNRVARKHFKDMGVPIARTHVEVAVSDSMGMEEVVRNYGIFIGGKFAEMPKEEFRQYLKDNNLLIDVKEED